MKKLLLVIVPMLIVLSSCQKKQVDYLHETPDEKENRMEWWEEARFGMFIHWGLYSVPAGEWKGSTNHAEWIRTTAQIPLEEYNKFVDQFNPIRFNAEEWVQMAKNAGMKYIVITSKHHDGFCLFDSKYTDFDIMSTPFHRDVLKELAAACKREGIRLCFYHSIMDWHHPDYLPRRSWETDRSTEDADFDKYVGYIKNELKELLTGYGKIGVLWFDGEWESTWNNAYGKDLYQYVRSYQPDIIVNNRVTVGRAGMEGMTSGEEFGGDFGTPEQEIPATGIPGYDWETCMTMNDHWGYNKHDKNFKSSTQIIRMLADIASKGGNFLLNIGPTAEGLFPIESVDRLKDIGSWIKTNGESIYGTQASPFKNLTWGRCTQKKMTASTRLYLHVFDWPENQRLEVPGLGSKPIRAYIMKDLEQNELTLEHKSGSLIIQVPSEEPDPWNSVIVLDIEGEPVVFDAPVISAFSDQFIDEAQIKINKKEEVSSIHYTLDGSDPSLESPIYHEPFTIQANCAIKAACFMENEQVSSIRSRSFTKVSVSPGRHLDEVKAGLLYNRYSGEWDSIPNYSGKTPKMTGISTDFTEANKETDEHFSIDYQGFIDIPADGLYQFFLTSDDGSLLYIGDQMVIDNDGLHGATTKSTTIALGKGLHSIRLSFFEKAGGNMLKLEWASESFTKETVSFSRLFYFK